ncbi:MAG: M15 family metallopeptidase [Clostridia bacterium]|jgi:D-alanyl-D-alanine carboxypeptidase|nr:M15 family metallopeptidase [Clostridia bacterium]
MKLKTITLFILMVALTACGRGREAAQIEQQLVSEGVEVSQAAEEPEVPQLPVMETSLEDYPLQTATDDVLVLVNKTHPVTRDYVADDLVTVEHCDPSVGTADTKKMRKTAADAIEQLIAGAAQDGYTLCMRTGYRSYDYQDYLFNSYAASYGEAEANTYSARPGQSEHQTGWCCDVGIPGWGLTAFDDTPEAAWVAENCWKYGFILRYPANKTDITGYIYESWHIRYVGLEVAEYITENGLTLEEYLGILD